MAPTFFRRQSNDTPAKTATDAMAPPPPALVKVALVGDSNVGKTSLMVRYVEGVFDETQLPTQGVNFMDKTVALRSQSVTFSIWDIGGHSDSESMLPLVCNDAAAILFMFDLTRPESLDAIREWHRKARALNQCAMPLLVGCKYDALLDTPAEEHLRMCSNARRFSEAIGAPLLFCSPSVPINVINTFKVILIRLFGLNPEVPLMTEPGEPLIIYERPAPVDSGAGAGSSASAALPQQQCPSSMAEASAGGRRSSASSIGGAAGAASTTSAGTSQLYGV